MRRLRAAHRDDSPSASGNARRAVRWRATGLHCVLGLVLVSIPAAQPAAADGIAPWGTFFGGTGDDAIVAVAADAAGRVYIAGTTTSPESPWGAPVGVRISFVARLSADGRTRDWTLPLGGRVRSLSVDPTGAHVVAAGEAYTGEHDPSDQFGAGGSLDGWVFVCSADGAYERSFGVGGSGEDTVTGAVMDAAGRIHAVGRAARATNTDSFPLITAAVGSKTDLPTGSDEGDAWYGRFTPENVAETISLLGGAGDDFALGVAANATGDAFVCGRTTSAAFTGTAASGTSRGLYTDGFVARLSRGADASTTLAWARYVAAVGFESATSVALAPNGDAVVGGNADVPSLGTAGAFQPRGLHGDAFVARITAQGALSWLSYLGGNGIDEMGGVAVLPGGDVVAAGTIRRRTVGASDVGDFPATVGAIQTLPAGADDAFVARLSSDGATLLHATRFAGAASDGAAGIAVLGSDTVVVAGVTVSSALPYANGLQTVRAGATDGFAARLDLPAATVSSVRVAAEVTGANVRVSWNPAAAAETATSQRVRSRAVSVDPGDVRTVAEVGPSVPTHTFTIPPGTLHDVWIESLDASGRSSWSNGFRVNDPGEPAPPADPPATPTDPGIVRDGANARFTWTDRSDDETGFEVQRAVGDGGFVTILTTGADVSGADVEVVGPVGTVNSFRVRALGEGAASEFTSAVSVTVRTTADLVVYRGYFRPAEGTRGRFRLRGRFAGIDDGSGFNPAVDAFRLAFGPLGAPVVLDLPAASLGWRARGDRLEWASRRSAEPGPRGRVTLNRRTGRTTIDLRGFAAAAPAADRVGVGADFDAEHVLWEAPWVLHRSGTYTYPR